MDALTAALKSIADEHGLSRIDVGYAPYGYSNGNAHASMWFDAPEGTIGFADYYGADMDAAIDGALRLKAVKLAIPCDLCGIPLTDADTAPCEPDHGTCPIASAA